jgi:hypothetical protein
LDGDSKRAPGLREGEPDPKASSLRPERTVGRGASLQPGVASARPGAGASQRVAEPVADLEVLDVVPNHFLFAVWKNVSLAVWRAAATATCVERLAVAIQSSIARNAGPRSSIHVILSGAGLPSAEARAGFVDLMRRSEGSLGCVGVVIDGSGFWSSALLGAMAGLRLVLPRSFDFRVCGSQEELLLWFPGAHERRTGVRTDQAELQGVLSQAIAKGV